MLILTKIPVVEIDGKENYDEFNLVVESHEDSNELVILRQGEKSVTVEADKLLRAITNATNW